MRVRFLQGALMPGRRTTLREKIAARIARRGDDAFLTREFRDLGEERQVLRALRELVDEGKLIRLGYGAYGRAEISPITKQPMLAGDGFGPASPPVPPHPNLPREPPPSPPD